MTYTFACRALQRQHAIAVDDFTVLKARNRGQKDWLPIPGVLLPDDRSSFRGALGVPCHDAGLVDAQSSSLREPGRQGQCNGRVKYTVALRVRPNYRNLLSGGINFISHGEHAGRLTS
jgi:hypothetical protein